MNGTHGQIIEQHFTRPGATTQLMNQRVTSNRIHGQHVDRKSHRMGYMVKRLITHSHQVDYTIKYLSTSPGTQCQAIDQNITSNRVASQIMDQTLIHICKCESSQNLHYLSERRTSESIINQSGKQLMSALLRPYHGTLMAQV